MWRWFIIIYPSFIKKGQTIGITAPSNGISKEIDIKRLNLAIKRFNDLGYNIYETKNVRTSYFGQSSDEKSQAEEVNKLFENKEISSIFCVSGGDFMCKIMPYIDFDIISNNPKWFLGYSDPTWLTYVITTKLDIATMYSNNFKSFSMNPLHTSLKNNIKLLKGVMVKQTSFERYESSRVNYASGDEGYILDKKVKYKEITNKDNVNIKGRIIGGCLDIISEIFGTKYDYTKDFITRYKDDGIIWYFDNCEFTCEQVIRTLYRFKDNGYFKNTNGIIFGRSLTVTSIYSFSFESAVKSVLCDLKIPIILDVDIGHIPPRFTIINGSIAKFSLQNGKGSISYELK